MQSLKILIIEDDEADVMWFKRALGSSKSKCFEIECALTLGDGLSRLKKEKPNIVICDLGLSDATALQAPTAVQKAAPELPIIVMTGSVNDEAIGIEAVRQGAQDYLVKGVIDAHGFLRAIDYAVERKKTLLLKDNFVHIVSHELRNPLSALKNALEMVVDGDAGDISVQAKKVLEIGLRCADRLMRTASGLLDLSKMEAKKLTLIISSFDLVSLADEVVFLFEAQAKNKGIKLRLSSGDHSVQVNGDRDMIARVLNNLLSNAMKSTTQGEVEITVVKEHESVRCSVRDTGKGIALDDLPKLFVKFEQFGKSSSEHGTGLGLSICKEIIEYHGGKIWADSEVGKGSSFHFSLPEDGGIGSN